MQYFLFGRSDNMSFVRKKFQYYLIYGLVVNTLFIFVEYRMRLGQVQNQFDSAPGFHYICIQLSYQLLNQFISRYEKSLFCLFKPSCRHVVICSMQQRWHQNRRKV